MNQRTKAERFQAVEEAVLQLIAQQGLARITISTISRKAKVSRPWIYVNFGRSIQPLIAYAAKAVARRFGELDRHWEAGSLDEAHEIFRESARTRLRDAEKHPWITELYFQHLGQPGPLGDTIREIEAALIKKNENIFRDFFKVAPQDCRGRALKMVKMTMTFSHCWAHEPGFRRLGMEQVVQLMLPAFS